MTTSRNLITRLLKLQKTHMTGVQQVLKGIRNTPIFAAIQGLSEPIEALVALVNSKHDDAIGELKREHYAILNDDGPNVHAAREFHKNHVLVQPLPDNVVRDQEYLRVSPRLYYTSFGGAVAEEVVNAPDIFATLTPNCPLGPVIDDWSGNLLTLAGILPGEFVATSRVDGKEVRVLDMFPINREPFDKPTQTSVQLQLRDKSDLFGGDLRLSVDHWLVETHHTLAMTLQQYPNKHKTSYLAADEAHEKANVTVVFKVQYEGLGYNIRMQATCSAIENGYQDAANELFRTPFLPGQNPDFSDSVKLDLPTEYFNRRPLDHRVVVYNSIEDTYCFGTAGMLPGKESRELMRNYFKMIGVLQPEGKLRDSRELGDYIRGLFSEYSFEVGTEKVIWLNKRSHDDSPRLNQLVLTKVVVDESIKLMVKFALFDYSHPHYETLRTHPERADYGMFASHRLQPPDVYQFSAWQDDRIGDRGLNAAGDHLYTLRTQNHLINAIQIFVGQVNSQ